MLTVVVILDRDAGISTEVQVSSGGKISDVKKELAAQDPTGDTKTEDIALRLPLKPGRLALPLPDGMVITEKHAELEVIASDAPSTDAPSTREDDAPEDPVLGEEPATEPHEADEEPPFPAMSPAGVTSLSEPDQDKQSHLKQEASDAVADGNLEQALEHMTGAICLGCASALLYSRRAQILLDLGRPRAAINDCAAALDINPDAAKAFKIRGRAHMSLEQWALAQEDFQEGLKIDYDDETYAVSLEAANNLKGHVEADEAEEEPLTQLWEVLGSAGQNGVDVREDIGVLSGLKPDRLATGSIIEEIVLSGRDMFFRKVDGEGPDEGWITTIEYDSPVACRVYPNGEPPFPKSAPPHIRELSDEERDQQNSLKQRSSDELEAGDAEEALKLLSKAVSIGCPSGLMYTKRAQILLQLGRPRAAISDCSAAIIINPQSGKAFKTRARARSKLEEWEEAHADFQEGLKYECDDEASFDECEKVAATLRMLESSALRGSSQMWEIVGGSDTGGLLVRDNVDVASHPKAIRLCCGAIVGELELRGERLHYRKVSGTGPHEGWISIALHAKVLAVRLSSADVAVDEEAAVLDEKETSFPPMAPKGVLDLNDEARDKQNGLKQDAADAAEAGNQALALEKITEAICVGCPSALMYSRRAQILLQLGRPRAAIRDCTAALDINPDSGKAFGIRARAYSRLRQWMEAHADFQESLKIDFDDDLYNESLKAAEKAKGIQGANTEQRLKLEEADRRLKIQEAREAQEAEAEKEAAQKRKDRLAAEANAARVMDDPSMADIFIKAKRAGWMTDFGGTKRGPCSCNKCVVYCWRPVKLSSCAAANAPITCVSCGCHPQKHVSLGFATIDDLKADE